MFPTDFSGDDNECELHDGFEFSAPLIGPNTMTTTTLSSSPSSSVDDELSLEDFLPTLGLLSGGEEILQMRKYELFKSKYVGVQTLAKEREQIIEKLTQDHEKLKEDHAALEDTYKSLQTTHAATTNELKNATKPLKWSVARVNPSEESKKTITRLRTERDASRHQYKILYNQWKDFYQPERVEMKAKIANLEQERNELKARCDDLKKSNNNSKLESAVLESEASQKELQIVSVHLVSSNLQLEASEGQLEASKQELESSRQQLKSCEQELDQFKVDFQDTYDELQVSEQQLKASNQQLEASNEALNSAQQDLANCQFEVEVLKSELAHNSDILRKHLEYAELKLCACNAELGAARQELESLLKNLAESQLELENLKQVLTQNLDDASQALELEAPTEQAEVAEQPILDKFQIVHKKLIDQFQDLKEICTELRIRRSALVKELDVKQDEIQDVNKTCTILECEIRDLCTRKRDLESAYGAKKEEFQAQIAKSEHKLDQVVAEKESALARLAEFEQKYAKLYRQIYSLEEGNEGKDFAKFLRANAKKLWATQEEFTKACETFPLMMFDIMTLGGAGGQ